ncbi:MAG: Clp protease ClpP [Clostridia bacterium]
MPKNKTAPFTPVNIARDYYTMAAVNGNDAEITMYGDIVESRPVNWRTGEPEAGDFIILSEFLEDLNTLSNAANITIHMNSAGGDAYSAIPIHNRLRELKAKKTCIVDGVAMSGGSLIMCAADIVRVNPSSLVMIHKCWSYLLGGYNADEMRSLAAGFDSVDKAQAAIYKRKCGLDEDIILSMMADTTYLTGKEAVEKGFADELTEDDPIEIAASADRSTIYVGGKMMRLPKCAEIPEALSLPVVTSSPVAGAIKTKPDNTGSEGGKIMANTLEELRTENPVLAAQIEAEAKAAASPDAGALEQAMESERNRLSAIDEIANLFDDDTVREAKYGEHPCTAQEMTYLSAQKASKTGKAFMKAADSDYKASGAADVTGQPGADDTGKPTTPEQCMNEARANVKALLGDKKEG